MKGILALLLALFATAANGDSIDGRVIGVSDGDTVILLTDSSEKLRVRLTEIDAPESNQPYGDDSRQRLAVMIHKKNVRVVSSGHDRYGRVLGRIYVGGIDVNRQMVKEGAAWVYRQYMTDRVFLSDERAAKNAKRGLWALQKDQQIPPWDWRRGVRPADPVSEESTNWSCGLKGRKTVCGQLRSCKEAMFYLEQCGFQHLDRDGDSVPCESICR